MLYAERRKILIAALEKHAGDRLEIVSAEAGMHLVGLLAPGVNDTAMARKALEAGISTLALSTCHLERGRRGGLILGYGGIGPEEIESGARKLAALL